MGGRGRRRRSRRRPRARVGCARRRRTATGTGTGRKRVRYRDIGETYLQRPRDWRRLSTMSVRLSTEVGKKPLRRATLSTGVAFWAAAMIAFLGFAANTAASPLYRIYQAEFGFSATTLTLLFAVYIVVLLLTLLVLGSVSDYVGRRRVMLAGLASGAVACGLFLVAHGVGLLFCARALQGVAVGLIAGAASAALLDLRPNSGAALVVS